MPGKRVQESMDNWFVHHREGYKTFLRILFGVFWLVDAWFKWQPDFISNFASNVSAASAGQPSFLSGWFSFWSGVVSVNPSLFAYMTAVIETLLALGLLFGFARKLTYSLGTVFSFFVWSIPEGFGGPYTPGATDIGSSIIYVIVFLFLLLVNATYGRSRHSLDYYIEKKFPGWARIAEFRHASEVSE